METVLSCNFENDACGFTNASNFKWERSRGSAEKITDLDGLTQPPSGFKKGSWFLYSVIQDLYGGSLGKLLELKLFIQKLIEENVNIFRPQSEFVGLLLLWDTRGHNMI